MSTALIATLRDEPPMVESTEWVCPNYHRKDCSAYLQKIGTGYLCPECGEQFADEAELSRYYSAVIDELSERVQSAELEAAEAHSATNAMRAKAEQARAILQ